MNDIFFRHFPCIFKKILSRSPGPCERSGDHVEADKHKENNRHPEWNLEGREMPAKQEAGRYDCKEAKRKVEVKDSHEAKHEHEEDGLNDIFPKFLVMEMV